MLDFPVVFAVAGAIFFAALLAYPLVFPPEERIERDDYEITNIRFRKWGHE